MRYVKLGASVCITFMGILACAPSPDPAGPPPSGYPVMVRFATFNVEQLSREKLDRVDARGRGIDPQLMAAAEIVQRVQPVVLLLNEIDFDEGRENPRLFVERYLKVPQGGQQAIDFPYVFFEPSNTGVLSPFDFDRDGRVSLPEDGWGFGHYPGEYAMALLSRFPIDAAAARTFRELRWSAVPGHRIPDGTDGQPAWYPPDVAAGMRLSSKSHWDVPITLAGTVVHVLASHPTPPVFDGPEDRNGRRNFDEIRLWADYLTGGEAAAWIVDDAGRRGGLDPEAPFVVLGDLNADPWSGESLSDESGKRAIWQLLDHPRVQDPRPAGEGGRHVEREYAGPPEGRTNEWGRLDYVLPSADLELASAGIFWPASDDPLARLVDGDTAASDHHLVWVDLRLATAP